MFSLTVLSAITCKYPDLQRSNIRSNGAGPSTGGHHQYTWIQQTSLHQTAWRQLLCVPRSFTQQIWALHRVGVHIFNTTTICYFGWGTLDHSSVSFLAGKMIEALQQNELPKVLDITPVDILCVKVAGLCHDLGEHYLGLCIWRKWNILQDMDHTPICSRHGSSSH